MKIDKKRITRELEEMIASHVMDSVEVDVAARQIFEKFIEPALVYLQDKDKLPEQYAPKV